LLWVPFYLTVGHSDDSTAEKESDRRADSLGGKPETRYSINCHLSFGCSIMQRIKRFVKSAFGTLAPLACGDHSISNGTIGSRCPAQVISCGQVI
jgi:hypothetical protein